MAGLVLLLINVPKGQGPCHLLSAPFYLVCSQTSPFFLTLAGAHGLCAPETA